MAETPEEKESDAARNEIRRLLGLDIIPSDMADELYARWLLALNFYNNRGNNGVER